MVIYLQQDADDLHMVWLMSLPCLYLFPHKNPEWFTFGLLSPYAVCSAEDVICL